MHFNVACLQADSLRSLFVKYILLIFFAGCCETNSLCWCCLQCYSDWLECIDGICPQMGFQVSVS